MNKKLIIPVVIVLLILIVGAAKTCGGGNKISIPWESVTPQHASVDSVEFQL